MWVMPDENVMDPPFHHLPNPRLIKSNRRRKVPMPGATELELLATGDRAAGPQAS